MTTSRYHIINNLQPHFLTCTVSEWQPVFAYAQYRDIVIENLSFLIRTRDIKLHAYVIMENHLHLIASSETLEKQIARFRSYTARRIIDLLIVSNRSTILELCRNKGAAHRADRTHAFWASGFHPESIINHNMLTQKITYIHNNPVRRGYVDDAVHWRYSSARNYRGFPGELDIEILGM